MICDQFFAANKKWVVLYCAHGTEKWLEFLAGQSHCLAVLAEFLVDQVFLKTRAHDKINVVNTQAIQFKSVSHF
jgi:hypothetical protein